MNASVTDPVMKKRVERWLRDMDGCYTFHDIMAGIHEGKFQSHVFGNTWVLTAIHDYPQKRSVHIELVVGSLEDALAAEPAVCEWARSIGAVRITGSGRPGWDPLRNLVEGWRMTGYSYSKDL